MENKSNNKLIIALLVFFVLLSICSVGYIVYDNLINKQENKLNEKSDWDKYVESQKMSLKETIILKQCDSCTDKYEFKLTTDGKILLTTDLKPDLDETIENYNNKIIFENVIAYADVHVSQSDICNGNERLVVINELGKVSYFDIDSLLCGHEFIVKKNIGELKEIAKIKEEKEYISEYESYNYKVFAEDINGKSIDISHYLLANN